MMLQIRNAIFAVIMVPLLLRGLWKETNALSRIIEDGLSGVAPSQEDLEVRVNKGKNATKRANEEDESSILTEMTQTTSPAAERSNATTATIDVTETTHDEKNDAQEEQPKMATINTTATSTTTAKEKKHRAFVCVTGQLQRLILKAKVDTFFRPILEAGYDLDIALVLTEGKARYTNGAWAGANAAAVEWTRFDNVTRYLKEQGLSVVGSESTITVAANPPVSPKYLRVLDKGGNLKRGQNHARQFEQWTHCYQAMKEAPEHYYEAVMRIRDDMAFSPPFNFTSVLPLIDQSNHTLVTYDCRAWGGINDRFALLSPAIAHPYFNAPHKRFTVDAALGGNSTFFDTGNIHNPETYLKKIYQTKGFQIKPTALLRHVFGYTSVNPTTGEVQIVPKERRILCPRGTGTDRPIVY